MLPAEDWRRNQIAVNVAAGLLFFGFTLVMPFLPFFIESLGARGGEVEVWSGLVLFTAPFLAAMMGPIWGRMTDRYGMKIMIQRIVIAMALHWILMYFVGSLAHLMVLRVMLGVFSGFGTFSVALITHGVPREKVGTVVGSLQSVQVLSAAAGPAVGGLLFDRVGLRPTFLITAGICALGFVLVTFAYREISPGDGARPQQGGPLPFRDIVRLPGLVTLLVLLLFSNLVERSFGLIVPLFLQDLVGTDRSLGLWSGLTVSGGAFAGAVSALGLARMAGRTGPRPWILGSLATAAVLLLGMAAVRGPWAFAALRTAYGLAAGGLLTLGYTLASNFIPERSRATTYAVLSGAAMLGAALGPLSAGLMAPWMGFRGFLAAAAAILAGLLILVAAASGRERRAVPPGEARPYIAIPR